MSFPNDKREAAAYEWLKSQDLSGKSPIEIYEMLDKAIKDISEKYHSSIKKWD
ncbi:MULTISPECIES: hypothetical protein [Lentilactobacillus]|uniref:hypothetical protein n=1 Tax=Lentilactobacillus TaxID=2767893 RepID=UPI001485DBA0|nr:MULTISPECIES: hypothetical protein [Lentilactobacillus]